MLTCLCFLVFKHARVKKNDFVAVCQFSVGIPWYHKYSQRNSLCKHIDAHMVARLWDGRPTSPPSSDKQCQLWRSRQRPFYPRLSWASARIKSNLIGWGWDTPPHSMLIYNSKYVSCGRREVSSWPREQCTWGQWKFSSHIFWPSSGNKPFVWKLGLSLGTSLILINISDVFWRVHAIWFLDGNVSNHFFHFPVYLAKKEHILWGSLILFFPYFEKPLYIIGCFFTILCRFHFVCRLP